MGWSYRKTHRIGNFRITHSHSSRGAYISIGAGGFTYRIPLTDKKKQPRPTPARLERFAAPLPQVQINEIDSADTELLTDVSSRELLDRINAHNNRLPLFILPLIGVICLTILAAYLSQVGVPVDSLSNRFIIAGMIGCILLSGIVYFFRDSSKFELVYGDDEKTQEAQDTINGLMSLLPKCEYVWHVEGCEKDVVQQIHRKRISVSRSKPDFVETNISVYSIPVGKQTLYFFPDKLYISEGKRLAILDYGELQIDVRRMNMNERQIMPADARLVSQTWELTRVNGSRIEDIRIIREFYL